MSDELLTMDQWMGWEVPEPRSPAETMELAFRAEDLKLTAERKRSAELVATRQTDRRDQAEWAAFMGREVPSHADVIARYAAAADQADRWQAYLEQRAAERAAQAREQARQEKVADLEDEVATSSTRAERLATKLGKANEGWAHARDEARSFRDRLYR